MTEFRASITRVSNLHDDIVNSLDFIKWKEVVRKDSTVFIKPNFTYPFYKQGVTTNPLVLKEVLSIFKDRADRVMVGESDGGNHSFPADAAFRGHGMPDICKETGAELVNLSAIPAETVEGTIQRKSVKVQLPKLLLHDVDCFISLPVLKIHVMTTVTLSMKNLWGCYPDTMRCLHHKNLSRKLTLITKSLNPQLILVDGTYALDGHGPMHGTAIQSNLILSANNPVVADSLGSAIMGIPLSRVDHITMAEKEGLGITDLSKVIMNGDWDKYAMKFTVNKTIIDNLSWILFNSETCAKLVIDSPLKPLIYGIATKLRDGDEKQVSEDIKKRV
jgi:uncharacterized protein (DUF362 family)